MQIIVLSPWQLLAELEFGKVLGVGTFGVVYEINHRELSHREEDRWSNTSDAETEITTDGREVAVIDGLIHNSIVAVRDLIARKCMRYGEARYAVKKLNDDLYGFDAVAGRVDLAVEVKLLHSLSHPNIVKMRGVFDTDDPFHPNFFFVMDRLYGTLYDTILEWRKSSKGEKFDFIQTFRTLLKGQNINIWNREFMKERLLIAHDIASAYRYMHKNKVIHR